MSGFRIAGVGAALPDKILTNNDLKEFMDTSDEWIKERTGISERRVGSSTLELATNAALQAIERSHLEASQIENIVLATTTPEQLCPGTAPAVANNLGIQCGAFDVQAACAGWVYGLMVANGLLLQGAKNVLLIGAEALDKITDFTDRGTGILFGNGGAATILEASEDATGKILAWDLDSNGALGSILYADHGSNFHMEGREVFKKAVTVIESSVNKVLREADVKPADIKLVVPHQANIRIIELAWRKLGFTMDQTATVLERTGNTSAASIPIALEEAVTEGRVEPGDLVLFVGFGAGMTWASALIEWDAP